MPEPSCVVHAYTRAGYETLRTDDYGEASAFLEARRDRLCCRVVLRHDGREATSIHRTAPDGKRCGFYPTADGHVVYVCETANPHALPPRTP